MNARLLSSRTSRRRWLVLAAGVAGGGLLAACSQAAPAPAPTAKPAAPTAPPEERFKDMHDQLRSVGALKADMDYKAAFNPSFITAAQGAAA
jgi:hypothetical protein